MKAAHILVIIHPPERNNSGTRPSAMEGTTSVQFQLESPDCAKKIPSLHCINELSSSNSAGGVLKHGHPRTFKIGGRARAHRHIRAHIKVVVAKMKPERPSSAAPNSIASLCHITKGTPTTSATIAEHKNSPQCIMVLLLPAMRNRGE